MQEKQFIQKGARKVRLDEYLEKELEGAGYSRSEIVRTPTSTKIVIHAQRPGLVIGRGGSRIRELTETLEEKFDFEKPQIEVNEIEEGDADAEVVAKSIASWLEKGGHAKRVGYTYIRRMKESGVIGAEIEISGKLSGNRGRTEKFSFGYVKRCGNTSKANVDHAYQLARTKPGAIGVKVRIMKELPEFMHRNVDVQQEILHETSEGEEAASKPSRIQQIIEEAENMTSAELERAIEAKADNIETGDISKQEIRDAFENQDLEVEQDESEETESQESQEDKEEEQDTETTTADFVPEEIVDQTISDAKEQIKELEESSDTLKIDPILEAEKEAKDRKTFKEWLKRRKN